MRVKKPTKIEVIPNRIVCSNKAIEPKADILSTENSWDREERLVKEAIAQFPVRFGLAAYPGKEFMLVPSACYFSSLEGVMLYTFIWDDKAQKWESFAKGTVAELKRQITEVK